MIRKDFTAVSAFSVIAAFAAGAALCSQFSQTDLQVGLQASTPVLWAVEAVIFGTAVFIWCSRASFFGWILGIASLMIFRVAVASAGGMVVVFTQGMGDPGAALEQTAGLVPRGCAILFSLMACYPLRVFLPLRESQAIRRGRGFADSAAVRSATAATGDGDRGLLIVTVKNRADDEEQVPAFTPQAASPGAVPRLDIEGEIELPLSRVLTLLPEEVVTDKALALGDSQSLIISLDAIHPQLREGQVLFTLGELRGMLPPAVRKALVQPSDSEAEVESTPVALPLEVIVPQLPPEALELPPPSPPSWAEVDGTDTIVFATT